MSAQRKCHSAQFKFNVALEAAEGLKRINQLAGEHELHLNQVFQGERELLESGPGLFNRGADRKEREQEAMQADLYEQIGRLKVELNWLKKRGGSSRIRVNHPFR
jgi:transposase-like protein